MRHAGFVLVGGKSTRMGRDKALLPWNGSTLAQRAAGIVAEATGSATLIGDPTRYGSLGYPVIADRYPSCGPMGGIATALHASAAEWCLIVACDMPALCPDVLRLLLAETGNRTIQSVIPMGPSGPEALCAVYHRSCLPTFEKAIAAGRLKMRDAVGELAPSFVRGIAAACFANLNMPEDFEAFTER